MHPSFPLDSSTSPDPERHNDPMTQPGQRLVAIDSEPLELEHGAILPSLEIAYERWGKLAEDRNNVILVCPAFSAQSHAQSHVEDPSPGWWEGMIGPGAALDTDRYCVLCPSLLGGTSGTTGPTSINLATEEPYGKSFPAISVGDLVRVHLRLLDLLGIHQLQAVVGGSLGAMQTAELGVRHPGRARHVVAISGTDFTRPYTAAIRHLGRRAIQLDPDFQEGAYADQGPGAGLALARQMGTLYYRSREEFNSRFDRRPIATPSRDGITFEVQSYLEYQGQKAIGRFDANSYLTLSLAMDLHDLWRGDRSREEILAPVAASFFIVGVPEDRLIPHDEQLALHHALESAGKASTFHSMSSQIGHDAFLAEIPRTGELVGGYLRRHG